MMILRLISQNHLRTADTSRKKRGTLKLTSVQPIESIVVRIFYQILRKQTWERLQLLYKYKYKCKMMH